MSKASASKAGLNLKFPKTTLGNGTLGTTVANATGSTLTGTKVGSFTYTLGNLDDVVLNGFDASGQPAGSVEFPTTGSFGKCTNDAGTTQLMSGGNPVTVKVVKDSTKTTESAKYASKSHTATGKAKVKSTYGYQGQRHREVHPQEGLEDHQVDQRQGEQEGRRHGGVQEGHGGGQVLHHRQVHR